MRPGRHGDQCETSVKVELVLRLLAGKTLAEVAADSGRPRRQLSTWRKRFLEGGEAYLESRPSSGVIEALQSSARELSARVSELECQNLELSRRIAMFVKNDSPQRALHPYCTAAYSRALEEQGTRSLHVPDWGTYVLVRNGPNGTSQAKGTRPFASLAPNSDVRAGLEALRAEGVTSVSLVTDPLWCPDPQALQQAFDSCRAFKENYLLDRAASIQIGKRHRNRINQARRVGEVREVSLAEHLDRWKELYEGNVISREIPQPDTAKFFERLTALECLHTIAVFIGDELATFTLWLRYDDILYFHNSASSDAGFRTSAAYAAFAYVIENITDCRYVFLGGSSDFVDDKADGLAMFRRGFANATAMSYLCSARLK